MGDLLRHLVTAVVVVAVFVVGAMLMVAWYAASMPELPPTLTP